MSYIADLTGGKAYYNTNDIEGAIRKAIDDSSVTYTLGYYVPESNWNNKYHKIKVKVRRSGVSVRTKKGYLAHEQPIPSPAKLEQILHETVWSPLDSTTLEMTARIDPSPALPNASRLYFALDTAALQFTQEKERWAGSLDIVFAQQTKKGKLLTDYKQTISIHATPEQYASLRAKGFTAGRDLKLNLDTEAIRIVVLDRGSGLTGSITVPVTPKDRSSADPAPASSGTGTSSPTNTQDLSGKPPRL